MKRIMLVVILALFFNGKADNDFWQPAQGLWGGGIDGIAVQNGKVYAFRSPNVFMSVDGGDSWSTITGYGLSNIRCMAISPAGHLYLGVLMLGVWWTTNNGNSWSYNQITHNPHTGLGASILAMGINSQGNIFTPSFRSYDGGNNWQEFNSPSFINAFAFGDQDQIFTGTYDGVYLSTDDGNSWTARNSGITNTRIYALAIDSNGNLFAGSDQQGIFFSDDDGMTWSARNTGLGSLEITDIKIAPNGDVFAGTKDQGIFRSNDQGVTWTQLNGNLTDLHIQSIALGANSEIYVGTAAGGIFKSIDDGTSWTVKNQNINVPYQNAAIATSNNDFFLATRGSGVLHSPDGHSNWSGRNNGLTNLYVSDLTVGNEGDLFAGTSAGVFRSSDMGNNWIPSRNGIEDQNIVRIKTAAEGRLFALSKTGSFGTLFYSDDNGDTWTPDSLGVDNIFIESMAVDSMGNLFLSASNFFVEGLVFKSIDNGATWSSTVVSSFSTGSLITIDSNNRLYAVFNGDEIYYSDNAGSSWTMLNPTGLPSGNDITQLAFNTADQAYAATQSMGIYYSEDDGNTWTAKNDGLPATNGSYPAFTFLYVSPEDVVYGGTYYDGLFVGGNLPISVNTSEIAFTDFTLDQNYPNPFNPSTAIPFSIQQPGHVELAIFNTLGQKVKTLYSGKAVPGRHLVQWDGRDESGNLAASGIYIYRLKQENRILVGRMILMK